MINWFTLRVRATIKLLFLSFFFAKRTTGRVRLRCRGPPMTERRLKEQTSHCDTTVHLWSTNHLLVGKDRLRQTFISRDSFSEFGNSVTCWCIGLRDLAGKWLNSITQPQKALMAYHIYLLRVEYNTLMQVSPHKPLSPQTLSLPHPASPQGCSCRPVPGKRYNRCASTHPFQELTPLFRILRFASIRLFRSLVIRLLPCGREGGFSPSRLLPFALYFSLLPFLFPFFSF